MGKPQHYSADLPARCLQLLEELQPHASQIFMPRQDKGLGPLTATFALTMAIPIITLPYERLYNLDNADFHYADDRQLKDELTASVKTEMGLEKLSHSQFYRPDVWRFVTVDRPPFFNLGKEFPHPVSESLSQEAAVSAAADMPVSLWISCLRNALAHGGIAYLDEKGFPSYGQPIKMYAFVSGKYDRTGERRQLVRLNILRINQTDFIQFLRDWVDWLQKSGIELDAAA
ncbi:MAG: hypothetical protein ABJL17_15610 [Parvibaculum sp.]|uniref:hypothetical protein n=1 Tax=Parvibaculum sp. TaxID=2024848 RepID=UPI0032673EEA